MLGTAASSRTYGDGMSGQTETEKSGAEILLMSSSSMTSLAICRRLEARFQPLHFADVGFETVARARSLSTQPIIRQ